MLFQPQYNVTSFKLKQPKMTKETLAGGFVVDGDLNQLSDTDLTTLLDRLTKIKHERDVVADKMKKAVINEKIDVLKKRISENMEELKQIIIVNDLEDEISIPIDDAELCIEYGDWKAY